MNQTATGEQTRPEEVLFERRDEIQWVIFNRPQSRNALTWNMYEGLARACEAVNADRSIKAMVITGAGGKAFAAGTDIAQFREFKTERDALDYEARTNRIMTTIETVRVPTIAAVAGACTGGGAGVAASCDLRIVSPSARYGFPIARTLGNCLSIQSYARLLALLGMARTKDLIMTARLMEPAEMLAAGFVSEMTPDEASLESRAQDLALRLASFAPLTLQATKEALRRIRDQLVPVEAEDLVLLCYMSRDFREGIEAFYAKRKPEWRGE